MTRIIDERASGKTSRLMLLAKENNAAIVCASPYAMRQKAEGYGIIGLEFVSYYDFIQDKLEGWTSDKTYYIDELEAFTNAVCNNLGLRTMLGYTLSKE